MTSVSSLSIDELARHCAEETEKFNRRRANDSQFCFELLRRALAEDIHEAFTRAYQIYERQVLGWVYGHGGFAQTGESADFFARVALSTFYFALRGAKFARFPGLPQVLTYLKLCVHTAITQYLRDQQPQPNVSLEIEHDRGHDRGHTPDLGARASAEEIWGRACALLPDARDHLLARYAFLQDLKPRQILETAPGHWNDEREITVALYRIRRLLRGDPQLRRMLGLGDDESGAGVPGDNGRDISG